VLVGGCGGINGSVVFVGGEGRKGGGGGGGGGGGDGE